MESIEDLGRIHLMGVGGAGMRNLAKVVLQGGHPVSGCDVKDSLNLHALRQLGADVHIGHHPDHLRDADTVVYSSAIPPSNAELATARGRGLRVLPRAALLGAAMAGRRSVAVAGTHGKTTTTSMLTVALQSAHVDVSFVIGGELGESGSGGHAGRSDLFVAEADESDGSFLLLAPTAAIVTNVDLDHVDRYPSMAEVHAAFADFLRRLDPDGFALLCADDPGAMQLAGTPDLPRVLTYGTVAGAGYAVTDVAMDARGTSFTLAGHGPARLALPGMHNVLNAAAALAAGIELGLPFDALAHGLASFRGARRRLQLVGEVDGVRVLDNYDHHPTEIAALLRAARQLAPDGRVLVVFQPHRYTRTRAFLAEFAAALGAADVAVVTDVYPAGEEPIPGVTGLAIVDLVPRERTEASYQSSPASAAAAVAAAARPGDVVLTVGAGDIGTLAPEIVDQLALRHQLGA